MKIAITSSGKDLSAQVDMRFGRAPRFIVYDLDEDTFQVVDNSQGLEAAGGAGIQSGETVARIGAGAVVTGHCGPKAFKVLSTAGIKIYNVGPSTVREAIDSYRSGDLTEATGADVDSHWV